MKTMEMKHISAIDALSALDVRGSWFLRNELQEYMDEEQITELLKRLDVVYNKGCVLNAGRSYNPTYLFNRVIGIDTQKPQIALRLYVPGNHVHNSRCAGEVLLDLIFGEHGTLKLALPEETPAEKLVRENNWKVTQAELAALTQLIEAAKALQAIGSKSFPISVDLGREGVTIQTRYYNPVDQVRDALAR